jgi:LacI family transcriptional regulator
MNVANKPMNLKQLADHLNLSQATVSRALNGYPEIREATRNKVLAAAAEFGYRANSIARSLATGRSGNIGIVFQDGLGLLFDPHFLEFLAGATEALATRDMSINLSMPDKNRESSKYADIIRSHLADGFVVNGPTEQDPRVALLQSLKTPFIVHGRTEAEKPYAWVDIDNILAFQRATQLLVGFGHQRIALINAPKHFTFAVHREIGFKRALAQAGFQADESLIFNEPMTEEGGYRLTMQALAKKPRPTAILCSSMLHALGSFRALRDANLNVPGDISVIAHDDVFPYITAEAMRPALTTTRSPLRQHGRRIAEVLNDIIDGKLPSDFHELIPVELVLRDSVGPARKD